RNGLEALGAIARLKEAPLVVRDAQVLVGAAVGTDSVRAAFDEDVNIVSLAHHQDEERDSEPAVDEAATPPEPRRTAELKTLGAPGLRVGQNATLKVRDPQDAVAGTLRVEQVRHEFSTSAGYTCDVTVVAAQPGKLGDAPRGAYGVVRRVADV